MTFKHAVGDIDAHAKNVSFLRLDDGTAVVSPVYDSAMHLHATAGHDGRSAIEIGGKSSTVDIGASDLVDEARSWGMSSARSRRIVAETLGQLHSALGEIDRGAHPGVSDPAWQTVEQRVSKLATQAPRPARSRRGRSSSPR